MAVDSTSFDMIQQLFILCISSLLLLACSISAKKTECLQGQQQMCYDGPSSTQNRGICKAGYQICNEQGMWGICQDQQLPTLESCTDQVDNNCDGVVNEGCCQQWAPFITLTIPLIKDKYLSYPEFVTFGPDGKMLIVGVGGGYALWNITENLSFSLKTNPIDQTIIPSDIFTADGKNMLLYTYSKEDRDGIAYQDKNGEFYGKHEINFWNWQENKIIKKIQYIDYDRSKSKYIRLGTSSIGDKLALFRYNDVVIIDANTGKEIHRYTDIPFGVRGTIAPDGSLLAIESLIEHPNVRSSMHILVFDLTSNQLINLSQNLESRFVPVSFHPNKEYILGESSLNIILWERNSNRLVYTLDDLLITNISLNKQWTTMAYIDSSSAKNLVFVDIATGRTLQTIPSPPANTILSVSFHPNNKLVAFVRFKQSEVNIWRCAK